MNWTVASLLMMFGSVCLYLTIRKSSILKFPTQFNNLSMFLVPLAIYALLGYLKHSSYAISIQNLVIIFFASALFSYLANVTSLKSIELAPNPGYSLIISKSYVVLTTIISFLFLGGEITIIKSIAIFLIIIFSALIMIDPKGTKKTKSNMWLLYALYSFFGWGFLSLTIKYLTLQGLEVLTILTYLYIFVSLFIFSEKFYKKIKFQLNLSGILFFLLIGVSSALFNYFNFYAVSIAPNVGYVNATNASSISFVTIMAAVLFKDDFSVRKMFGVFGVTAGLLLLFL